MLVKLLLCLLSCGSVQAGNAIGVAIDDARVDYDKGRNLLYRDARLGRLNGKTLNSRLRRIKEKGLTYQPGSRSNPETAWITEFSFPDASKCDNDGQIPLHAVAQYGVVSCIAPLVEYGPSVDVQDSEGNTPLHIAYKHNKMDVVNELRVTHGANETLVNNAGQTPSQMG